jgi:hypothetical protein
MDLNIHPPLPHRKDFHSSILSSGFVANGCHPVAYAIAGFNPVAIASRNPCDGLRTNRLWTTN